ncbi:MAG: Small ribosomal subunit biogenesis GTPase RsgA [Bacteroidia bacterium]|nr:Small ribosomal subunit biogenesis GTPase RsgA [Bacteroidia bacterium]
MEAVITKSTGSWFTALTDDRQKIECRLRGNMRLQGSKSTNPVAVGDRVKLEFSDTGDAVIAEVLDRKNYIVRKSINLSKQTHVLAANIDLAIVIATIAEPRTSTGFIDRFLCTAEAYKIPGMVVFNKIDMLNKTQTASMKELMSIYENIGYKSLAVSATEGTNLDALKTVMKDKVSLISGHSGTGKSTLVNALDNNLNLRTGEISSVHLKGKHTTTFAEMFELEFGGFVIDTPGIKEFGLTGLEDEELAHYFPEMLERLSDCKYYNCKHVSEPGCAVKAAVEKGEISISRYSSYLGMLENKA